MKKVLLATLVGAAIAGSAFAAAPPVTDIMGGNSHVGLNYSITSHNGGHPYGASLSTALNDNVALQYTYGHSYYMKNVAEAGQPAKMESEGTSFNEFTGYYRLNDNFNAYVMAGEAAGTWGYQAGVVGYMPIQDNLQGYAKLGFGNNFANSVQVGVKYDINPEFDATVFYNNDNYKGHDAFNSLNVGVGYKF